MKLSLRLILLFLCIWYLALGAWGVVQKAYCQDAKEEEALFIARKAMDDGYYDTAISLLERFSGNYPETQLKAEANLLVGECYFHQNKFLDSLKKFEGLLDLPEALSIKDSVIYWIAEVHFKGNNFIKAATYYKKILEEFPKSGYVPGSYYSLGWCYFQGQRFNEAIEYFRILRDKLPDFPQVQDAGFKTIECLYNLKDYLGLKKEINSYIKLYPNDSGRIPYLYFYLAEADYYLNNFSLAIEEYSRVISDLSDQRIQALSKLGLAWTYLKLKQYQKSEEIFLGLKSDSLENENLYFLLLGKAGLYFETNRFAQAIKVYDELLLVAVNPQIMAQVYLGKAESCLALKEYNESVKVLEEALDKIDQGMIPPDSADKIHYSLGTTFLKLGDFKGAAREFQKVSEISKDQELRAGALTDLAGVFQEEGDYAKALEVYRNISRDYHNSFYADYVQYQLGLVLIKSGDYDQAVSVLKDFSKQFPGSKMLPDVYYALGSAYFQKQDYNLSREVFQKFAQNYKDSNLNSVAMYLLGNSLYNLGDFTEAIKVFKDIIGIYGQNSELSQKAEYQIADCYFQLGDDKEAMSRFNALRSKYPQSNLTPDVIWWLGEYYYQNDDLGLSRRYFYSLTQDFPQNALIPDAWYILGSIYKQEGEYPQAIDYFTKVIDSTRQDLNNKAVINLAEVYVKNNEPEKALIFYRKGLESSGKAEIGIRFKMAEILQALNRTREAKEEYLKISDMPSENKEYIIKSLFRLAQMYENSLERQEALRIYEKIVLMAVPESRYAQERIGLLKSK